MKDIKDIIIQFYKSLDETTKAILVLPIISLCIVPIAIKSVGKNNTIQIVWAWLALTVITMIIVAIIKLRYLKSNPTTIEILNNRQEIKSCIKKNQSKTMLQTFFQNEPLVVRNDEIDNLLKNDVSLSRYVKISNPIDIYFAWHCLKYVTKIDYIPILGNTFSKEIRSFPNITIFKENDGLMITHPFKENPFDSLSYIRDLSDPVSSGYFIKEPKLLKQLEGYLNNFKKYISFKGNSFQIVERAKKSFFSKDKKNYLKAIAVNIQRELTANEGSKLNSSIDFIGVVGSVAKKVIDPGDIDILIIVREYTHELKEKIEEIAAEIAKAYSFLEVSFEVTFEIGPIKPVKEKTLPIHLLVHSVDTIRSWDKFILYDWSLSSITLFREYSFSEKDVEFTVTDVINSRYGCVSSENVIKNGAIAQKQWLKSEDNRYIIDNAMPTKLSEKQLKKYISYSVWWLIINIARARQKQPIHFLSDEYIKNVFNFLNLSDKNKEILTFLMNSEYCNLEASKKASLAFFNSVKEKEISDIENNFPNITIVGGVN